MDYKKENELLVEQSIVLKDEIFRLRCQNTTLIFEIGELRKSRITKIKQKALRFLLKFTSKKL